MKRKGKNIIFPSMLLFSKCGKEESEQIGPKTIMISVFAQLNMGLSLTGSGALVSFLMV